MTGLDVIATALRLAKPGAGSLVVLRGPLGCGRSKTLKDARKLAESTGVRVLRAAGARQERDFPFGVLHQLGEELDGPALITVDDLQWADEESLRALASLAERLDRLPVVMVVCVRDGDVGSDSPLVQQVVRRAAQVVTLPRPVLTEDSRRKLVTCLRAQPAQVRSVLDAMAVLGDDLELIMPLAEVDEIGCTTALRAMDRLGLVDHLAPRFVHPIVREAVEETMTPAHRVRLQTRAARLLHDAGKPVEIVAGRLLAITFAQGPWAVEVLRTAAESAMERGAPHVAVEHLRRALLEQPQAGSRRATLLAELATAERGVDRAAAATHLSVAARMVTTTRERAAIAARFVPGALAEAPPAVRELVGGIEDELRVARPHDDLLGELALRVEARSHHAECLAPGRFARCADRLGERPDRTYPATSAGRELMAVRLHCATIASAWRAGEVAVIAERLLSHAPARPDHVHTPIATLVTTLCAAGSVDAVSAWLLRALEHAASTEQVFIEAEQALVLLHSGRIAEARTIAENVLATAGTRRLASEVLVTLASIACETRDDNLVSRLMRLIKEETHHPALSVTYQMLCGAAGVAAEDLPAALAYLRDAGSQAQELGWRNPVLYPWRAEAAGVLWRMGDLAAARELAWEQHALAVQWGAAAGVGKALCHLASMTEGTAGVALLRQAVDVLEGSANRFELARAVEQLGQRTADRQVARAEQGDCPLTTAQRRAAELAMAGRSNQEIADVMRVSVRVVEKHLTNAYRKLGVQGRGGLSAALS
ncbi:LuxR C-terminal-related transcriptional regulator [Lentzea sp. NPDC006480]|uniref:helix-turn-helix transcriptional regulator n=1 Tax=Lentzea sp. NPDC006480 TaxID=3157176 RepID=UPI0033BD50C0